MNRNQLLGMIAVIAVILLVYTVLVNVSDRRKITEMNAIVVTVTIDGCEYLKIEPHATGLCHKGNCTNAIHRQSSH